MNTSRLTATAGLVALAFALSACAGANADKASGGTAGDTTSAGTSAPDAQMSTTPPTTASSIPNGIYRSHITAQELTKSNDPNVSDAGNWTFTVKDGTYTLSCSWVDTVSNGCGESGTAKNVYVEAGDLRGSGNVIWFVLDEGRIHDLNGCTPGDCGPQDYYRMHWKQNGSSIEFSDWTGFGAWQGALAPVNDWTFQPFTKIG